MTWRHIEVCGFFSAFEVSLKTRYINSLLLLLLLLLLYYNALRLASTRCQHWSSADVQLLVPQHNHTAAGHTTAARQHGAAFRSSCHSVGASADGIWSRWPDHADRIDPETDELTGYIHRDDQWLQPLGTLCHTSCSLHIYFIFIFIYFIFFRIVTSPLLFTEHCHSQFGS